MSLAEDGTIGGCAETGAGNTSAHYRKVLEYIVKYGDKSGLQRVISVCDMTLKGRDCFEHLRDEPRRDKTAG